MNKKPQKTLGFCRLRQVALGCFIIFHTRARIENNKSTRRNLAHSVELAVIAGQKFATRSHPI